MSKVFFTKKAEKEFVHLSTQDRKRVIQKLKQLHLPLQQSPLPIKQLTGIKGFYRLRLGNIRIIFEIDNQRDEIWIRLVGYRGHIYRKLM